MKASEIIYNILGVGVFLSAIGFFIGGLVFMAGNQTNMIKGIELLLK